MLAVMIDIIIRKQRARGDWGGGGDARGVGWVVVGKDARESGL